MKSSISLRHYIFRGNRNCTGKLGAPSSSKTYLKPTQSKQADVPCMFQYNITLVRHRPKSPDQANYHSSPEILIPDVKRTNTYYCRGISRSGLWSSLSVAEPSGKASGYVAFSFAFVLLQPKQANKLAYAWTEMQTNYTTVDTCQNM